jgi:hypothetical protein
MERSETASRLIRISATVIVPDRALTVIYTPNKHLIEIRTYGEDVISDTPLTKDPSEAFWIRMTFWRRTG